MTFLQHMPNVYLRKLLLHMVIEWFFFSIIPEPCGASFINVSTGTQRTIPSPGWPDEQYPNKARCLWLLVAEVGYRVVVTFTMMDLEEKYDFLKIGNGDTFADPFLKLTG